MGQNLKTTVVIPNYNGIAYLDACLTSVLKSRVPVSVIVVDNGSTDESRELVKERYPQVHLLSFPDNRGFCTAVNAGILAAHTPYVFLLNNDTRMEPDCIERLEEALEQRRDLFSVGAKMLSMQEPDRVDGAGDLYCAFGWAYAVGKGKESGRFTRPAEVFSNCAGAALYRREELIALGLFDENHFAYLEDVDLGYRARIAGYRNLMEPAAIVYHAGSGFSGSRYNAFKIRHSSRNSVYLVYKNMPFLQILLNLPFLAAGFAIKLVFFTVKGYGGIYAKGLLEGIKLCRTKEGRARKVPFLTKNLGHYARIQWELWWNLLRRL